MSLLDVQVLLVQFKSHFLSGRAQLVLYLCLLPNKTIIVVTGFPVL